MGCSDPEINKHMAYFKMAYFLGFPPSEVDLMDAVIVDTFQYWLNEINSKGGGGKKDRSDIEKAFMG